MKTIKLSSSPSLYNQRPDTGGPLQFSRYRSLQTTDLVVPAKTERLMRSGNAVRANDLIGKVVRGYSVTAEIECLSQPSSNGEYRVEMGCNYFLFRGTPQQQVAATVFILPDNSLITINKTGKGEWQPYRGYRTSRPDVIGLVPALHVRVSEAWPVSSIPMFKVTKADCDSGANSEDWIGPKLQTFAGYTPIRLAALKFDVSYSDPPTWAAISTGWAAVGAKTTAPTILITAKYPDDDKDPVMGLSITATTSGEYATVSSDGDRFGPVAVAITDETGAAGFYVRGEKTGEATIDVRATDASALHLFDPPLAASATVKVYGADGDVGGGGDPGSDDPPIDVVPGEGQTPVQNPVTGCITYPRQQYVPPVPARFDVKTSMDWDAGANSVDELDGDVSLKFDCKKVVGVVIGYVSERGDVTDYSRMSHAFHLHQSASGTPLAVVMEAGRVMGELVAYLPDETVFEIRRVAGVVSYLIDGAVVLQSRTPSVGMVMAGCSLYATGDTVPGSTGGGGGLVSGGYVTAGYLFLCGTNFSTATSITIIEMADYQYDDVYPDCGEAYNSIIGEWSVVDYQLEYRDGQWWLPGGMPTAGVYLFKIVSNDGEMIYADFEAGID